ncbi:amino acid/amide ABC transporter substrate-binding protein, HAAT family [Lacrimispora sphenoides]|jgi:branched-chain amino acid transport system substrate-binding protein|uniref:ABC transporter substrate-binding protein n=1 Tax=Lacrimispora sphenoides TaxID=29370 RepID=UPI0008B8CFC6|nr:ABC transporter substrate-binding protein [Lacrimispora sphenoides]SEU05206.1 amino acid/amide ABC transporter substrate-binding protein, HAAT family [Lacrimispora sphenoides]
MKLKKVFAITLAACLSASMVAGCSTGSSSSASGGEKVVKIGVFEPTTGENGGGGFQELLGMRYAKQTHPTVKIGGEEYKVELVEVDNKSDKTEAVNAAQKLVSEKVSVVLGSYGSGVSIAAGQIFADAKIPAIGASCTNPQVTQGNDFYFRVCFLDPFQGTVMANYANDNGAKTAAVITQLGDDYSSGLGSFFKTAFTGLGGNIVSEEQFQTNQTDFKAILTNIKAQNPDIIFAPSSITTAPLIIKQARELGITATIAAGDTWENSTIIENAGSSAQGVVLSTFFDEAEPANEEAAAFISGFKAYLKENKQDEIIPAVSALGYDSYLCALKAIETAGSTDGTAIRDALKGVSIDGVTGSISFDENGDAKKDMAFIKTIENGKFKFLTTTTVK